MNTARTVLHETDPYTGFIPKPELIRGWESTAPIFKAMVQAVQPKRIIEVGSWLGASAIHMAGLCREQGLQTEIVCVDTWLGSLEMWTEHADSTRYGQLELVNGYPSLYYQFLSNVVHKGFTDLITPCPLPSAIAARLFAAKDITCDLCYIDASHDEEDVLADIAAYLPLVNPGGFLFGDDLDWPSVERALKRCPWMWQRTDRWWKIAAP